MLLRGLPSMGTWGCVWGLFRLVHFAVAQLWQAENADRPEQGVYEYGLRDASPPARHRRL